MQELTLQETDQVSGGDGVTAGAFGIGLGTSLLIGASLGPVGIVTAAGTYIVVYTAARLMAA
ncbi:hypothetical protein [Dyella sedimenti]|uniref:hypothetical protein n=1 Tax=Dyella sedimenti TaxID=2919947 RepID=UPI001FAAF9A6|nr:hypothetical protein [Dyella sedimenti]